MLDVLKKSDWNKNNTYKIPNGSVAFTFKITSSKNSIIILRDFWTKGVYEVKCDMIGLEKTFTSENIEQAQKQALNLVWSELERQKADIEKIQFLIKQH